MAAFGIYQECCEYFPMEARLRGAKITAIGTFTPPGLLTNQDLEKTIETTDQWIMERTGIRTRHIAAPEVETSDMATAAARNLW